MVICLKFNRIIVCVYLILCLGQKLVLSSDLYRLASGNGQSKGTKLNLFENDKPQSERKLIYDHAKNLSPNKVNNLKWLNNYNGTRRRTNKRSIFSRSSLQDHLGNDDKGRENEDNTWLDMGSYSSYGGSFGWYVDHPVGNENNQFDEYPNSDEEQQQASNRKNFFKRGKKEKRKKRAK